MLVRPEPDEDAVEKGAQAAPDAAVFRVEGAEPGVVGEEDHGAAILPIPEDRVLEPGDVLVGEPGKAFEEELEQRKLPREVAAVDAEDPPVLVLEAEVAGLLADLGKGEPE